MQIPDGTIDEWVNGLPRADVLHIVSLLGEKVGGYSEFNYYPFRSSKVSGEEPTFEEWLNKRYDRQFKVHEFPTVDARSMQAETFDSVVKQIRVLLDAGHTVVVVDSAGEVRTGDLCSRMGYRSMGYR